MAEYFVVVDVDDQQIVNESEDFLSLLTTLPSVNEYGPSMDTAIASRFESILKQDSSKEDVELLLKKLAVPINCKLMGTPKVNPELWAQLSQKTRLKDVKLQSVQKMISRSLVAYAKLTELLMTNSRSLPTDFVKSSLEYLVSGTNAAAAAQKDLAFERKMAIKPFLNPDFSAICADHSLQPELLFGENLVDTLKATKATSNVVKSVSSRPNNKSDHRFAPYQNNRNRGNLNWRGRSRFRGGGQQHRGAHRSSMLGLNNEKSTR